MAERRPVAMPGSCSRHVAAVLLIAHAVSQFGPGNGRLGNQPAPNPNAQCDAHGTGVSCPVGLLPRE
jgi:hypothetical protein